MFLIFKTKKNTWNGIGWGTHFNLLKQIWIGFLENRVQITQQTIKSIYVLSQCAYKKYILFVYLGKPIGMFNCFFLFSFVFHFILFSIRHTFLLLFIFFLKRSTYCSTIEAFVFPRKLVLVYIYIPFSCFKSFFPRIFYMNRLKNSICKSNVWPKYKLCIFLFLAISFVVYIILYKIDYMQNFSAKNCRILKINWANDQFFFIVWFKHEKLHK